MKASCLSIPKRGSGAYGHWFCERERHSWFSRCRYRNYTWWRVPWPFKAWSTVQYQPQERV